MEKTRKKTQIIQRRMKVAELYLAGKYQHEIAEMAGLNQATVSRDVKALQQLWLKQAVTDMDAVRTRELARIDKLEREYWQAWDRSKQDAQKLVAKGIAAADGKMQNKEAIKTTEGQAGEASYLRGVQWCVEQRLKIFGLYAPEQLEVKNLTVTFNMPTDG